MPSADSAASLTDCPGTLNLKAQRASSMEDIAAALFSIPTTSLNLAGDSCTTGFQDFSREQKNLCKIQANP